MGVTLAGFDPVPSSLRADQAWLESIPAAGHSEAVIELQPVLTRAESSLVLRTIAEALDRSHGEAILGSGTDFSGRGWVRAALTRRAILSIVRK